MRILHISIEKNGEQTAVGQITGDSFQDARFQYDSSWLDRSDAIPVSLSLPLQEEAFSPEKTRIYFAGLLPEGFTRKTVAHWLHADEGDYLSMLVGLGQECLGAIQVLEEGTTPEKAAYLRMTKQQLQEFAREGAMKSAELLAESHLSLTGASGKTGLYYDAANDEWYLPRGTAPSTHIVKQCHVRLKSIITNEQLCMNTAARLGIPVPKSFVVRTSEIPGSSEENMLFATPRYDRIMSDPNRKLDNLPIPFRLHQEDLAQALGIPAAEKYEQEPSGYLKKCCDLILQYTGSYGRDIKQFWQEIILDFLIGNTDGHIKNFSLLYQENLKGLHLAPAYDIVSTTIYPSGTRNLSMFIGGKNRIDEIGRSDFALAAKETGIPSSVVMGQFDRLADGFEAALKEAASDLMREGFQDAEEIREKILETSGYRNL